MLSQVDRFLAKVELELNNKTGAINDAAYMPNVKPVQIPMKPTIDPKYDWYQNMTHSFITFKTNAKVEDANILIEAHFVTVKAGEQEICKIELSNECDPSASSFQVMQKKIEIKLAKKTPNQNWMTLGKGDKGTLMATQIP